MLESNLSNMKNELILVALPYQTVKTSQRWIVLERKENAIHFKMSL
jgi:hypothetical protein